MNIRKEKKKKIIKKFFKRNKAIEITLVHIADECVIFLLIDRMWRSRKSYRNVSLLSLVHFKSAFNVWISKENTWKHEPSIRVKKEKKKKKIHSIEKFSEAEWGEPKWLWLS